MRFNKDVEYALIALLAMARRTRLVSAKEISEEFSVPYGLLSKILQRLAGSGIVGSVQGARGGYRLTRSTGDISLAEIITAVQGERHVARCLDDESCGQLEVCNIRDGIESVQSMCDRFLSSMTLREFSDQRARADDESDRGEGFGQRSPVGASLEGAGGRTDPEGARQ